MSTVNTTKIPFRGIFFSTYIYIYIYIYILYIYILYIYIYIYHIMKALLDISILILEETITQLN